MACVSFVFWFFLDRDKHLLCLWLTQATSNWNANISSHQTSQVSNTYKYRFIFFTSSLLRWHFFFFFWYFPLVQWSFVFTSLSINSSNNSNSCHLIGHYDIEDSIFLFFFISFTLTHFYWIQIMIMVTDTHWDKPKQNCNIFILQVLYVYIYTWMATECMSMRTTLRTHRFIDK